MKPIGMRISSLPFPPFRFCFLFSSSMSLLSFVGPVILVSLVVSRVGATNARSQFLLQSFGLVETFSLRADAVSGTQIKIDAFCSAQQLNVAKSTL